MLRRDHIGQLIQCHIDQNDPETFVVGVLISFDDDWLLMQDVSVYGESNGFALYQRTDLVSFEEESNYLDKMHILLQYSQASWPNTHIQGRNLLTQVLEYCCFSGKVVGIETHASGFRDVNGVVEKVDENIAVLKQIDEYGKCDGNCWLNVGSITRMYFNDKESICLDFLRKYYMGK